MQNRLKLALAAIVIFVGTLAMSPTVFAAVPESFVAKGYTRYAAVGATNTVNTTSQTYADVPNLTTSIKIPSGKKGDVFVFFCGAPTSESSLDVRALVGGAATSPNQMPLRGTSTSSESRCANFFVLGVSAGTKDVKMQWKDGGIIGTNTQGMTSRSMIVVVNIH